MKRTFLLGLMSLPLVGACSLFTGTAQVAIKGSTP
jgi:hypothetical protein